MWQKSVFRYKPLPIIDSNVCVIRPPMNPSNGNALSSQRLYVLMMLVLVSTFNFIDRQIIGILDVPIKSDLGLADTQLGLMGGLEFALF